MKKFNITAPGNAIKNDLQDKINNKTKPLGALGKLEEIALKIGWIHQTLTPELKKPVITVFAADHGIAEKGLVNPYPQDVTWQMVLNFLSGGAAINVFAKQNDIEVKVVDAGVKYDFGDNPNLINAKIALGTKNYLEEPAMSATECEKAINIGAEIIHDIYNSGTNILGFGEMGIGNTSAASLLMSKLAYIPISDCVGSGTGLDSEGINRKKEVLQKVIEKHQVKNNPEEVLATFGGFEIAMICGAMLQAAELGMVILVDGFIVTAALLVASKMNPNVLDYCIFGHTSEEKGHQKLLDHLGAKPLLNLGMRLGEGTGAAVAYPLLKSAVNFLNEMASFESANVSNKED